MIDDFSVNSENLWQSVGASLIEKIKSTAKIRGIAQILVVRVDRNHPKQKFLMDLNLSIAFEWFARDVV